MSPSKGNPLQMATMSPSTLDRTFHKDYAIPINSGSHAVCLAYSHNGDFLASTSMSSVTVRQSQTGSVRAVFTGSSIALTLLWTHSDDTLLCGFHDGIVTTIAFDDKKQVSCKLADLVVVKTLDNAGYTLSWVQSIRWPREMYQLASL
jgi:hypothetical protein